MSLHTRPSASGEGLPHQPHHHREGRVHRDCPSDLAVFRSPLRGWRPRRVRVADWPGLSDFAESAEGFRALHRVVLAALFVFGVMHGVGAGTLRHFLQLAGLALWFACSESTLRHSRTAAQGWRSQAHGLSPPRAALFRSLSHDLNARSCARNTVRFATLV